MGRGTPGRSKGFPHQASTSHSRYKPLPPSRPFPVLPVPSRSPHHAQRRPRRDRFRPRRAEGGYRRAPSSASASPSSSARRSSAASASTPAPSPARPCARPCCTSPATASAACTARLRRQAEHHDGRPALPLPPRRPDRGRRHPQPDPRNGVDIVNGDGSLRRPQHRASRRPSAAARRTRRHAAENILIAVGTAAAPGRPRAVRRPTASSTATSSCTLDTLPAQHDHRRRRRHRHRVRLHAGRRSACASRSSKAARGCWTSSTTRSPRPCSTACADMGITPAAGREGREHRAHRSTTGTAATLVEATLASGKSAARRDAALRRRPPGRDRRLNLDRRRPRPPTTAGG